MSNARKIFSPKSYVVGNTAELIRGGKYFFLKLILVIDSAQSTIHFQNYILDDDETGRSVCDALKRAAKRGVNVFLMLDAWGSRALDENFISSLQDSGIN
ncbi:MAG: cardiolipin synthase, partial [Bacteroidia bacterium]|nr:cardiolipin synthase [Bacteroidia bacterium]